MNRGEIWTASGGKHYADKPRPVVIPQSDFFSETASLTICQLTSDRTDLPLLRIPVGANPGTGLEQESRMMVDKVTTVPRVKIGRKIGVVPVTMDELSRALMVFLGIA